MDFKDIKYLEYLNKLRDKYVIYFNKYIKKLELPYSNKLSYNILLNKTKSTNILYFEEKTKYNILLLFLNHFENKEIFTILINNFIDILYRQTLINVLSL